MRTMFFWVFPLIVLSGMGYVLWHVWAILPFCKWLKWIVVIVMAFCTVGMFMLFGGALDRWPQPAACAAYEVSTSAIFVMLYLLITFLVLDIGRLVRLVPPSLLRDSWAGTIGVTLLMVVVFVAGNIKYHNKVRVPIELTTTKPIAHDYRMVMVSDLHLGFHNRRADLARWIDLINAEKPDMVLIAGDIVDISLRPLIEERMAEEFHRLNAPVYACLGNHEYYSNEPRAREFYQQAGIRLLSDSATVVDSTLCIIGRDDRTNPDRKELATLTHDIPDSLYTIVLDHQPYNLEKTEQCKVDFQFSGHTHRGQVWPISWITDAIYECSWGSHQRGGTRFYVSSGLGIWGGKFRIGTQSEYVVVTLKATPSH